MDNLDKPWNWYQMISNQFTKNKYVFRRIVKNELRSRKKYIKDILETVSYFSRNIDSLISRRINYF
jgi:hypothetical protein